MKQKLIVIEQIYYYLKKQNYKYFVFPLFKDNMNGYLMENKK